MNRRKFILSSSALISLPFILGLTGCEEKFSKNTNKKTTENNPKIEKLNLALEHEFGAIVQYCNHAGIGDNNYLKKIIPEIVSQEVNHAIAISNIIKSLGYSPTLSLWPPQTGKTLSEMINKDINAEKNAIELYEDILKLNLAKKIKKTVYKIIKHEENHLKIFKNLKI